MKVYVIKNKEGKYWSGGAGEYKQYTNNLQNAQWIVKQNHILCEDEYWQEVTLCEGDLEKELAVRDKALELQKKFAEDIIYKMNYCGGATCDDIKSNEYFIDEARKELGEKDE